jgi:hypothetical protein
MNRLASAAAAASLLVAFHADACTAVGDLCINEIQTYGTGSPTARRSTQYLELRGPAGAQIAAGTYIVSIDGDRNQNPGTIDSVIDLSGKSFGSNGFLVFLAGGSAYSTDPSAAVEASGTTGFSGIAGWSGNSGAVAYERPSTTFLLVTAAAAPAPGVDIDTVGSNDGVPDGATYASWTILDSVAIADNANDKTYAALNFRPNVGSFGTSVVLAGRTWYAGRFGDSFGSTAGAWVGSSVLGGSNPNFSLSASTVAPVGVAGKPLNHVGASNVWANAAPVNALPTAPAVDEDATADLALGVSDSDAGSAALSVALAVDVGSLTLASTAGLSIASGANGSAAVTVSGPLSALNAALNGLDFAAPADYFGSAHLSITSNDNGNFGTDGAKSDADVLQIDVRPVNDAPSFTVGANQTVNADAGAQTVVGFATSLSPGPANESAQALDFIVSNDATLLFLVQPAIAPNGDLSYTPNPSFTGTANVSVAVHDDGGTANGGVDTSDSQTFTITLEAPLAPATVTTITDDDGDDLLPLNGTVQFTVDFSRNVDGASAAPADFSFTGTGAASIDAVSIVDADSVLVQATATGGGTLVLNLTGEVLDTFAIAVATPAVDDTTLTVDAQAPTLASVNLVSSSPTNAATLDYAVTFSEDMAGVSAADFTLAGDGTLAGFAISAVNGSGSSYTVSVDTGSGSGTLALGLAAAPAATDVAGNVLASSLLSAGYAIDRIAPQPVSITLLDANPPTVPFVAFQVVFDESVSGVDIPDFTPVMGGGVSEALVLDVSGSGTTYSVLVYTGLVSGTLGLELLDDDSIVDAATNPLAAGLVGTLSYTIDSTALGPIFKDSFEN